MRPYFITKDGRLALDDSFRRSTASRLQQLPFISEAFEWSRVLQVFRKAQYKLQAYLKEVAQPPEMKDRVGPDITIDQQMYLDPPDPHWNMPGRSPRKWSD